MKRVYLLLTLLLVCCGIYGCGNKSEYKEEREQKKLQIYDDEFISEAGYIIENQTYDYSQRFDTTYQWMDGVNMPFDKIKDVNVSFQDKELYMENVSYDMLSDYVETFKEEGYYVHEKKNEFGLYIQYVYHMCKDNISIGMTWYEEAPDEDKERLYIFVYVGNVLGEREVTIEDARNIIDKSELFSKSGYEDKYYLVEISNESVRKQGYFEFMFYIPGYFIEGESSSYVHYIVTEGKEVVFYRQLPGGFFYPSSMNIVEENGDKKYILTYGKGPGSSSGYFYYGVVEIYVLEGKEFVLKNTCTEGDKMIAAKVKEGKINYYVLEQNQDITVKDGNKEAWIIKGEYNIQN